MDEQRDHEGMPKAQSIVDWESPPLRETRIVTLLQNLQPSPRIMINSSDNMMVDATTLISNGRQYTLWAMARLKEKRGDTKTPDILNTLGCALLWAQEYDEAEATFKEVLEFDTPKVDEVKNKVKFNLSILEALRKIPEPDV